VSGLFVVLVVAAVLTLAYRYYSAFLAARVLVLDDARRTPAHRLYDGQNYYPTGRWVLFGHHFAAITGAGPLIGPVLAAQFGYFPGLAWLVVGVVVAGAVHDFTILVASARRDGRSLAELARSEISPRAYVLAAVAILFIVVIALAGLGLAVVNALRESSWGTFTIAMSIPIAVAMGLWMYRLRPGRVAEATVAGVLAMMACVILGRWIPQTPLGAVFTLGKTQLTLAMAAYGFVASVLPVWLLLAPRDYLSTYMKLGTIALLALGVCLVNPVLKMPAVTEYAAGGGPIVPGPLFPFLFITIACGAISGFHSLVGSGTTPKMLDRESDARPIGFGAMLCEGVVGVMALIAATSLHPADYFAINVTPEKFAALGLVPVNLAELQAEVGETLAGRTGGAVSLAVGMAQIFSGIPGMRGLMGYWYHFAIMFEALFILTTIDAGTRVARFILQEVAGRVHKPLGRTDWLPGAAVASLLVCGGWTYFILTGSISTIWPMFGIANQLLAGVALTVGTTILINSGRVRYAWVTAVPLVGVTAITQTAGFLSIRDNYLPRLTAGDPGQAFQGGLNATLTAIMMTCMALVLVEAGVRWWQVLSGRRPVVPDVCVTGGAAARPAPGFPSACC